MYLLGEDLNYLLALVIDSKLENKKDDLIYEDIKAVMDGDTNAKFVDIDESMIAKVKQRKLMRDKKAVQIEYEQ